MKSVGIPALSVATLAILGLSSSQAGANEYSTIAADSGFIKWNPGAASENWRAENGMCLIYKMIRLIRGKNMNVNIQHIPENCNVSLYSSDVTSASVIPATILTSANNGQIIQRPGKSCSMMFVQPCDSTENVEIQWDATEMSTDREPEWGLIKTDAGGMTITSCEQKEFTLNIATLRNGGQSRVTIETINNAVGDDWWDQPAGPAWWIGTIYPQGIKSMWSNQGGITSTVSLPVDRSRPTMIVMSNGASATPCNSLSIKWESM